MVSCTICSSIATLCVAYVAVKVVFKILYLARWTLLVPKTDLKKYGRWALVTGCTSGIGEALVERLAAKGFNIFMVARNNQAMMELRSRLEAEHKTRNPPIEIQTFQLDVASPDAPKTARDVALRFNELTAASGQRGLVFNNAGLSYDHPEYFTEIPLARAVDIVSINSLFLTALCHEILPTIRNGGVVVNIASIAGVQEEPLLAAYSASKSFVVNLSAALDAECAARREYKGVRVQAVAPGMVCSKMSRVRKARWDCPNPKAYAAAVLTSIGQGESLIVPFVPHFLQYFALSAVPHAVSQTILWRMHADIRRRAIKKQERDAAAAAAGSK
eukprot:TRINITY_DN4475_c0_g1_i1.p2 TRINITY_DN4475_c0_g1~~TRINITY_DN4475_c0_g1_i1.p2  ORF type:complete len:331 (+),score=92.85 TRINITY_DN4475_c0_g1_i1:97-1089(+)